MTGWIKIKGAARYCGVSVRTFRGWLKKGLRHSRMSSGSVLIKISWLDEYLAGFEVQENHVDKITEEICGEIL